VIRFAGQSPRVSRLIDDFVVLRIADVKQIEHNEKSLRFCVPNSKIAGRIGSFATKEPETLRWIDQMPVDSVFWDIGANIGLYSIYAAKRGVKVVAVEPSVFNLESLARNINLNRVAAHVLIVPLAIGGATTTDEVHLTLSSTLWGYANNQLAVSSDGDGPSESFGYRIPAPSLDELGQLLPKKFREPMFLKIDVDGLEPVILERSPWVVGQSESILVEVPQHPESQETIRTVLTTANKQFYDRGRHNEIWSRVGPTIINTENFRTSQS